MAEIVKIRDGAPLLTDIPGMLRQTASAIEAGEYGEVNAAYLVIPSDEDYPEVFGWGDIDGVNDPIIQLELAKMFLLTNITKRK